MAKFLIVEARFYDHLNDMLIEGATDALKAAGHEHEIITVPGALEIPGAISMAIDANQYDGFVAIGVVIRGETYHFEIVAGESARGIMALSMDGAAVGNGIITTENEEQALARAAAHGGDRTAGIADLLSEKQPSRGTLAPLKSGRWRCCSARKKTII